MNFGKDMKRGRTMQFNLAGLSTLVLGNRDAMTSALEAALLENQAEVLLAQLPEVTAGLPLSGCLIVNHPIDSVESARLTAATEELGHRMAGATGGRIVHLLSAAAAVAIRRSPRKSAIMAAAMASVRTLAMTLGPKVLVNAVAAGAIVGEDGGFVRGGEHMLSHVPSGQPGQIADVINAVLFLCDPASSYLTGQMLVVDGGWAAGYGRNF